MNAAKMHVRVHSGSYLRSEDFGGVVYVHHRDRFFALDHDSFSFVMRHGRTWSEVDPDAVRATIQLAELGVLETNPPTAERAYSGPGVIGSGLTEIPSIGLPLVVNVFATALCHLGCVYCHAADLMTPELARSEERLGVGPTVETARLVPAMVRVITGGDPLANPERTVRVIEALAGATPLVLDTSGVGNFEELIPVLKAHQVHVRVSLDTVSEKNSRVRPAKGSSGSLANARLFSELSGDQFIPKPDASRASAQQLLTRCADEGITTSIQSVYSRALDDTSEWELFYRFIRDNTKVRNWIIHVAIEGGDARLRERKGNSVLPSDPRALRQLIETVEKDAVVSLRLTDTGRRPNSVFLVDSSGHLETEGFAKAGKLRLYDPAEARPDRVQSLFHYVDRFGHAARYLNWVEWRWRASGLEEEAISLELPPTRALSDQVGGVEHEMKLVVVDSDGLRESLSAAGFSGSGHAQLERDEYFDNAESSLSRSDYVVRLRVIDGVSTEVSLKGPRIHSGDGGYTRIEIEIPGSSAPEVRSSLEKRRLTRTWFLEKRRELWTAEGSSGTVALDEVAGAGWFVEIEGTVDFVARIRKAIAPHTGEPEARNYAEIVRDNYAQHGYPPPSGAEFSSHPEP